MRININCGTSRSDNTVEMLPVKEPDSGSLSFLLALRLICCIAVERVMGGVGVGVVRAKMRACDKY